MVTINNTDFIQNNTIYKYYNVYYQTLLRTRELRRISTTYMNALDIDLLNANPLDFKAT